MIDGLRKWFKPKEDTPVRPAAPIEVTIGIDYGTRFTKVAVGREGLEPSVWRDAKGRSLIPSVVYVTENGDVLPWPDTPPPGAWKVEYLKMLLAKPDDLRFAPPLPLLRGPLGTQAVKSLAALFLAEVIRRVRRSEETKPHLRDSSTRWLVNVGVPVQYYDAPERKTFQEVVSVAYLWHGASPAALHIDSLVSAYSATVADIVETGTPVSVFPELAAGLSEYIRDPNRPEGLYAFCDIGGGTIDGAVFRLNRGLGFPRLAILSAAVTSLGTAAVARDLIQKVSVGLSDDRLTILSEKTEKMLVDPVPHSTNVRELATQLFAHDGEVRQAVQNFIRGFVNDARLKRNVNGYTFRDPFSGKKIELRLLLAGGGSESTWYRATIQDLDPERNAAFDGIGTLRLETVKQPAHYRGKDFPRFVIAFGLANSPDLLEEASKLLPSKIPRKPPLQERTAMAVITKDQV